MITRIAIGASREVLLKLAADIQATFAEGTGEQSLSLWGKENTIRDTLAPIEIQLSNEDMEDRTDLPADAVFVDVDSE